MDEYEPYEQATEELLRQFKESQQQGEYNNGRMQTISTMLSEKKDILKELEYMSRIANIQRIVKETKPKAINNVNENTQNQVHTPPISEESTLTAGTLNVVNSQNSDIPVNASGINTSTNNNTHVSVQNRSKLPKLTLPKFKGDK